MDLDRVEVIVVDNASADGTHQFIKTQFPWVRYLRNDENLGFALASNQGASVARHEFILFLNNDTIALPGWLGPLQRRLNNDPTTAIAGSKLLYEDGTVQHAGAVVTRMNHSPMPLYQGNPADAPHVSRPRELHAVTGACMLVRRHIFDLVGGFDEAYINGFEDIDLCLKVVERGHRIFYEPESVLHHLESKTPGRHDHEIQNAILFRQRWADPKWVDQDRVFFEDGFRSRSIWMDGVACNYIDEIPDAIETERWRRPAEAQRLIHQFSLCDLRSLFEDPSLWPTDVSVLNWAARLCKQAGISDLAALYSEATERWWQPAPESDGLIPMTRGVTLPDAASAAS